MKVSCLRYKERLFLRFLLLSLLFTFAFGHTFNNLATEVWASPSDTVIAIDPPITTAEPNQYFTINLTIANVTNLFSWGAKISWPADLLRTHDDNVTEGAFLQKGGTTSFTKKAYLSYVNIGCTILGAGSYSGSGTIATIIFKVLDGGNCTLKLSKTTLYNSTLGLIDHTLQDGVFYTNQPVAKFTYTPNPLEYYGRPIVGDTITFNATPSYDPDEPYDSTPGGILGYQWDFGDGTTGTGNITTHQYSVNGSYIVALNVTDDEGKNDFTSRDMQGNPDVKITLHDITVTNVTVTPAVFSVGTTVTINVTVWNKGSAVENLNVTVYRNFHPVKTKMFLYYYLDVVGAWQPKVTLEPGDSQTTTIEWETTEWETTGPYPGNHTIGVYAFLIDPTPMESVPGIEKNEVLPDNWMSYGTITATGEEKHDIAVASIKVTPTDLKIDESSTIELTIKNEGNVGEQYNATLTITYGSELIKPQKKWGNQTLMAGTTDKLDLGPDKVWLKGANTTKEGDYNITVSIILVNSTTLDFLEPYNASTPDEDPTDNMLSVSKAIRLYPVSHLTYSPSAPRVDQPVSFNASASYAPGIPGGTIEEYSWDFGDGTHVVKTSPTVAHVYRLNGTYTMRLTVTDDSHLTSFLQKKVTVSSVMAHILMNVTFSPSVATSGQTVSVRVTVRNVGYVEETFNVTAYYDENEIGAETDLTQESGATATLKFMWDTTGVPNGYYTIKIVASKLEEGGPVENTYISGTVAIGMGGVSPGLTSNITISASPPSLNLGESTIVGGSISPVSMGARVVIHFRLREAETWSNVTVITDQDGNYEYTWEPQKIGLYVLKSILLGEDETVLGESEVGIAEVNERAAVDIFFYTTIGLAAGLAAVIVGVAFYISKLIHACLEKLDGLRHSLNVFSKGPNLPQREGASTKAPKKD